MLNQDELRTYGGYLLARGRWLAFRAFDQDIGGPLELKPVEFSVLLLLRGNPQASPAQLSSALNVAAPNMTGVLRRMEERGLVARTPCAEDRRVHHVVLTDSGRDLVGRAVEAGRDMDRRWMSSLTAAERAMLIELLGKAVGFHPAA